MQFHSFACSKICLRVEMSSLKNLPLRIPAFPLQNTLPVRLKRVILLQLLQSNRSPFFLSLTIRSVFQSSSMFSDIHISQKKFETVVNVRYFSACRRSALMSSAPGTLPFFILLMASLISRTDGISVFMFTCCAAARIGAVFFQVLVG